MSERESGVACGDGCRVSRESAPWFLIHSDLLQQLPAATTASADHRGRPSLASKFQTTQQDSCAVGVLFVPFIPLQQIDARSGKSKEAWKDSLQQEQAHLCSLLPGFTLCTLQLYHAKRMSSSSAQVSCCHPALGLQSLTCMLNHSHMPLAYALPQAAVQRARCLTCVLS